MDRRQIRRFQLEAAKPIAAESPETVAFQGAVSLRLTAGALSPELA